jgi:hypothetical protein
MEKIVVGVIYFFIGQSDRGFYALLLQMLHQLEYLDGIPAGNFI